MTVEHYFPLKSEYRFDAPLGDSRLVFESVVRFPRTRGGRITVEKPRGCLLSNSQDSVRIYKCLPSKYLVWSQVCDSCSSFIDGTCPLAARLAYKNQRFADGSIQELTTVPPEHIFINRSQV